MKIQAGVVALAEMDPGRSDELLACGERTRIDLDETIPVYIGYFTASVDADRVVHFHDALYNRDAKLESTLEGIAEESR